MAAVANGVEQNVKEFFNQVYGKDPKIDTENKKFTRFFIPDQRLEIRTDSFGGCHFFPNGVEEQYIPSVQRAITELASTFKKTHECKSIWLNQKLPASLTKLFAIAPDGYEVGVPGKCDIIRDEQDGYLKVWIWLDETECTIPPGATHNVGATAVLVDTVRRTVLLVEPKTRAGSLNSPGGTYDPEKDDKKVENTAWREAMEESGICTHDEFKRPDPLYVGELGFKNNQFAPAFNKIFAFNVPNLSLEPLNPPQDEISYAEWFTIDQVVSCGDKILCADGKTRKVGVDIARAVEAAVAERGFIELDHKDKNWKRVWISN